MGRRAGGRGGRAMQHSNPGGLDRRTGRQAGRQGRKQLKKGLSRTRLAGSLADAGSSRGLGLWSVGLLVRVRVL